MFANKLLIVLAIVVVFLQRDASAANFYVANDGSDTNSGSEKFPFHSLERARDEIRRLKMNGTARVDVISVIVRRGTYFLKTNFVLDARDSGTAATSVVWRAAADEEVRLCGGISVPSKAFHAVTNKIILSRLDAAARSHVLEANLRALGISKLNEYPNQFRGAPVVPELFFNDQRQQVARWPNEGWAAIAKIIAAGTNLSRLTQQQCDRIAAELNNRPRLRLGFKTPNEVYYQPLVALQI